MHKYDGKHNAVHYPDAQLRTTAYFSKTHVPTFRHTHVRATARITLYKQEKSQITNVNHVTVKRFSILKTLLLWGNFSTRRGQRTLHKESSSNDKGTNTRTPTTQPTIRAVLSSLLLEGPPFAEQLLILYLRRDT